MSGELLVIFIVALLVFKPKHLPMLARHLSFLYQKYLTFKTQALHWGQQEMAKIQLLDNEEKAKKADTLYKNKD